jgi:uncharacterized RDD family membrane protein YckC
MNDSSNPYASPTSTHPSEDFQRPLEFDSSPRVIPAGKGLRFANFIIDGIVITLIFYGAAFVIAAAWEEQGLEFLEGFGGTLLSLLLQFVYYAFLEATTSRTIGKMITGTKVVNQQGETASFGQVLGRSLCRFIPFEVFSFLGQTGRGWHDSLANTYVVQTRST